MDFAVIIGHENHKFSLPTSTSIYTEETYAIFKALKNDASSNSDSIVIIGDSLSALKTIITPYSKNELVQHIQELISTTNKAFTFMWVPSHVGISGNERADKFANEATLPHNAIQHPQKHSTPLTSKFLVNGRKNRLTFRSQIN